MDEIIQGDSLEKCEAAACSSPDAALLKQEEMDGADTERRGAADK